MRRLCQALLLAAILSVPALAQSTALAGIAHVAFRVTDLEKSRDFYRSLGFEQAFEFADGGETSVSYVKVNDRQFIELYQRKDQSQPIGFTHICFEATDLEALAKEYVVRGLDASTPRKARAGNLLSGIHDPDGQLIEYTQYLPGSLHSADAGKHLEENRVSRHLFRVGMHASNLAAVEAFYTDKLAFERVSNRARIILRLPGDSSEEVELAESDAASPGIFFEVPDVQQASETLLSRGLKVREANETVSVTDPDGTIVTFAVKSPSYRRKL
jgi:catechol 2,3-dioxygenase-like lactoylglutathione lyase family enzyme